MTGTIGQLGCISFYPGKNLGAAGEGGLIATNDAGLADRLRSLRNHGQRERYVHAELGFNYRMDGLQAAVLRHKLKLLSGWTSERRALAEFYHRNLPEFPLELPKLCNEDHVWHLYVVRTPYRDALRSHLHARGIETGLHYPVPLHRQPCLARFASASLDFPESDRWANEGLSLPLFLGMTNAQQKHVVSAIGEFFSRGSTCTCLKAALRSGQIQLGVKSVPKIAPIGARKRAFGDTEFGTAIAVARSELACAIPRG